MTASIGTVLELATKVGLDLHGCVTRSEMKRRVLAHYDVIHRKSFDEGFRDLIWVTQADTDLLDALEINSFRKR